MTAGREAAGERLVVSVVIDNPAAGQEPPDVSIEARPFDASALGGIAAGAAGAAADAAESAAAKAQRSPRGGLSSGRTRQQQTQAVMHERTGQMAEQRRLANHALGDAHQHKWGQVEFERVPGCWQLVGCKTHARQETVLR